MKLIRIFYAHPSGEDTETISQNSIRIQELIRAKGERAGKDLKVSVVPGHEDFRIHCRGDWNVWTKSVVKREHAITRKPYYDFIVVPGTTVGRATAQIVDLAVRAGRPVFLLSDEKLERITQVYPFDVDDWQEGFRCEPQPQQLELPFKEKEHGSTD
tara:strand:- start:3412 stop:3882 length:471 start_codon:yes stop_codon:yes gene_type:complete